MNYPILSTLWLSAALYLLGFAISTCEWDWAVVLLLMFIWSIVRVVQSIRRFDKLYRNLKVSQCYNAFASIWCMVMARISFDVGNDISAWINATISVLSFLTLLHGLWVMHRIGKNNATMARWKAEHFTPEELELYAKAEGV
ncbi:hypothetical protein [Pseudomonas sp. P8_250]|uniref:hypothetical protein n=1 Tax=Pseudomonas sp. P8_250 TaxID=3043446 RepID=UPI002A367F90|nr:hypothetical protein [Pseudomonas sp. P8_250]MDX9668752.1 hypothetical protein [Pseudomonas sp. P8_250]